MIKTDLFGRALYDYWYNQEPEDLITWTHLTEPEILPTAYLFRDFDKMPYVEQLALKKASGNILDIGAGSGIHSLWLQQQGRQVTALEYSKLSCQLMADRGIYQIVQSDFFDYNPNIRFDTLLFLMNGVGIVKKAKYLDRLFLQLKKLLTPTGQAFLHSSDLKYLYESDASFKMPSKTYYGDVDFYIGYKNQTEQFNWTYIDANTLRVVAKQQGFKTRLLHTSEEGDFLMSVYFK